MLARQVVSLKPKGACLNDARVAKLSLRPRKIAEAQSLFAGHSGSEAVSPQVGLCRLADSSMLPESCNAYSVTAKEVPVCQVMHANHPSNELLCAQDLLNGFQETQIAYLDLSMYPTAALQNAGPGSCVAGQLKLMPGMFGTPSQVLAFLKIRK